MSSFTRFLILTLLLLTFLTVQAAAEPALVRVSRRSRSRSSTPSSDADDDYDDPEDDSASTSDVDPSDTSSTTASSTESNTTAAAPVAASDASDEEANSSPYLHLFVNTAKPAPGGSSLTDTIFKEQALQPPFNTCVITKRANSSTCFKDDPYNDRITFKLTFIYPPEDIAAAFEAIPPELKFRDRKNAASPVIESAQVDVSASTAEVTVRYNCEPEMSGVIGLKLDIALLKESEDALTIQWMKSCKSGLNDKFSYGFLSTDKAGATEHHSFGTDAAESVVVGPADASTEFYMKSMQPGAQQEFLAPYVTTSDPDAVRVSVRGNHPNGGVVQGLSDTTFQVSYECATKGDATIRATVGIPPFDNITAEWTKDCGGKTPRNLQVGTEVNGFDIVDDGKPTPRYMVGITSMWKAHTDAHLHLPGNQSDWTFYIRNNDTMPGAGSSDSAMHIGHITATVERQGVLVPIPPEVYEKTPFGWRLMGRSPYALSAGSTLRVMMHLVCRKRGESRILMTVPVLGYKELEFGLAKECEHGGMTYKSSQFVLTVGDVFFIAIGIMVLTCACMYVRRRRAQKAGFSRLATTET